MTSEAKLTTAVATDEPQKSTEQSNPPDRRSLLKSAGMLLGAATALTAFATPADASGESTSAGPGTNVGLWASVVSSPNNSFPSFNVIEVFGGGGTYTGSGQTDLTPAALSSTAWGIWTKSGSRTFTYRFRYWTYDSNANPTGYGDSLFVGTVSANGMTFHAEGTTQFYDVNGSPLGAPITSNDDGKRLA